MVRDRIGSLRIRLPVELFRQHHGIYGSVRLPSRKLQQTMGLVQGAMGGSQGGSLQRGLQISYLRASGRGQDNGGTAELCLTCAHEVVV